MAMFENVGMSCPANSFVNSTIDPEMKYHFDSIPVSNKNKLGNAIEKMVDNLGDYRKISDIINMLGDNKSLGLLGEALVKIVDNQREELQTPIILSNFPNDTVSKAITIQLALANHQQGKVELFEDDNSSILSIIDELGRSELIVFDPSTKKVDVELRGNIQAKMYDANLGIRAVLSQYVKPNKISLLNQDIIKALINTSQHAQLNYENVNVNEIVSFEHTYQGIYYPGSQQMRDEIFNRMATSKSR